MTLSRTARFLILFLLLAAAAFVWVNFFLQDRAADTTDPVASDQPAPIQAGVQPAEGSTDAAPTVAGDTAAPTRSSVAPVETSTEGATEAPLVGSDAVPTVVAPTAQAPVERELVVAELPFLVTEPPVVEAAADGADDGSDVLRPQTRRASINPFSPVLVQVPAAPATPVAAAAAPPTDEPNIEVVAVEVPGAPTIAQLPREEIVETVVAPTPRPLAPPSPTAQNLPRQLPSGTLPVAPDILQSARVVPIVEDPIVEAQPDTPETPAETPTETPTVLRPQPGDVTAAAAIREPNDTLAADLDGAGIDASSAAGSLPGLLGPAEIVASEEPVDTTATIPTTTVPLAAGADLLSRYLRDNGFTFTGSVLGPVSVGVFTSPLYTAPVVVSLGQQLPDTDIVLTDLRGQQAEFTLEDSTQVLTLDLRR
jgi:hypothetical protein